MQKRRLAARTITAAIAMITLGFLTAGAGPAQATSYGAGAVTGTMSACAAGETTMTVDSPAVMFNGVVGAFHAEGTTSCFGGSLLADTGSGSFELDGPGVSCSGIQGVWQKLGTRLLLTFGGQCTFAAGGGHGVLFHIEAQVAAGTFAGAMVVHPVL